MNRSLIIVLAVCAAIGSTFAGRGEDRNLVFAKKGETPLKPARTLQILKRLSDAYNHDDCEGCIEKKREVDQLIAVSEASEEKCTQRFIVRLNKLMREQSESKLNLVPYLNHYKQRLISECRDQFEKNDLNWDSDEIENSDDASDIDDDDDDTFEESEKHRQLELEEKSRLEEEEKWLKQYEEERAKERKKQEEYNKDWLERYNAAFFKGIEAKEPEQFQDVLVKLNDDRVTVFGLPNGPDMKDRLEKLLNLRYIYTSSCSVNDFKIFDTLMDEYRDKAYNPTILKYVEHHRNLFWQTCKSRFFDFASRGTVKNGADLFSLVDYVWAVDRTNKQPHVRIQPASVQKGLAQYIQEKLGKKGIKKDKVNLLYQDTIEPMCDSLLFKFIGAQEIYQIIEHYSDLKDDFDDDGRRWLSALKICGSISANPQILQQAQSSLSEKKWRF